MYNRCHSNALSGNNGFASSGNGAHPYGNGYATPNGFRSNSSNGGSNTNHSLMNAPGYFPRPRGQSSLNNNGLVCSNVNGYVGGGNTDSVIPLAAIAPGPVWPSENQLAVSHGYAINNGDGTLTPLVPHGAPVGIGGDHIGLILLPPTRAPLPSQRAGNASVPREIVQTLPGINSARPEPHICVCPPRGNAMAGRRPDKEYCDKWIHEGVCAFTQMGCKYKHEMPLDKFTQAKVGIPNGLPNWFRRMFGHQLSENGTPLKGITICMPIKGHMKEYEDMCAREAEALRLAQEGGYSPPAPLIAPPPARPRNLSAATWRRSNDTNANGPQALRAFTAGQGSLIGPVCPPGNGDVRGLTDSGQAPDTEMDEGQIVDDDTILFSGRHHQ